MLRFHKTCGSLIEFSNNYCTAERKKAETDFYEGVVFSEEKLKTNTIFQVRLDKKVGFWSGGIQLGVTLVSPNELHPEAVPQSATELCYGTWLMASKTILKDGEVLIENYGTNLENLQEGDTVGLMRTNQGALVYFIQGVSQGVAVDYVPEDVFVVVNLYGKCAKVSVVDVQPYEQCSNTVEIVVHRELETNIADLSNYQLHSQIMDNNSSRDKLRFHSKCGPLVKLSNSQRTAERRRPLEEFNNSVVLTHRPLRENELFQVRIDMLVHKWSGSIEFGLITHNPEEFNCGVDFPATLTVLRNGSVIMSGNGILHDGKATNSPYIGLNLDQLQEGDRLGVMKKSTGDVVYFVNGESQGVAASGISQSVWGAVNLYGMCSRVTIVDRNDHEEYNLRLNLRDPVDPISNIEETSELLFHPHCGFHAAVINNGRTCHRPEASQDFNHGVVLTNRILKPNEMFEVRLDKMVKKWAGSIEIGVTTHRPTSLEYPCTMTNVRSGTWMMTGNGIMHNGQSVIDDYGQSLDRLKVGDRVSVLRKENGDLHFYVNSIDQGVAATELPESVYGVIDLYGQAAQATIIAHDAYGHDNYCTHDDRGSAVCFGGMSTPSGDAVTVSGDLKFHSLHGKNARISNNGVTASRPNARGEFNAAIVVSNRPLRDNELFEVIIEKMVDRWSGNIEAGVTTIRPENLLFPNTMTDIDHDTIMLSGSSIMSGGNTITTRYACNLDSLTVGSRVGMMRKSDNTLHFFINGEDMGVAASDVPQNIYAVVDLYGQCAQVSITRLGDMSMVSSQVVESLISLPIANDTSHRFSLCCGKNIVLKNNNLTACRVRHYNNAIIFSSTPLESDEMFEVRITEVSAKWAGSLIIGVTSLNVNDELPVNRVPNRVNGLNADTWYVKGSAVFKNQVILRQNYCVNLNRLCLGDRVGIRICQDKCMRVYVNGEDMGIAAFNLHKKLHVVLELYGSTASITITSTVKSIVASSPGDSTPATGIAGSDSCHSFAEDGQPVSNSGVPLTISNIAFGKHAANIELSNGDSVARRTSGYQGIVFSSQPLVKGQLVQLQIDRLNPKWTSSIIIGITEMSPDKIPTFPTSSLSLKNGTWVVVSDCLYENGVRAKDNFCSNLDNIQVGEVVSVLLDMQGSVHLIYNGSNNILHTNVSGKMRFFVDLYGETEQITIFTGEECPKLTISNINYIMNGNILANSSSFCSDKGINNNMSTNVADPSYCEYFQACLRFKSSLSLPEVYFVSTEPAICFCGKCMHVRGEESLKEQGDPVEKYTVPRNWVRFPININIDVNNSSSDQSMMNGLMTNSTSSLSNVLTTWHVAFYGLPIYQVRQVMDYGQLRFPEVYNASSEGATDSTKDENNGATELQFSPIIHYASLDEFAIPKKGYFDTKSKQRLSVKTVFELLVQPGSYRTSPPSYPTTPLYTQSNGNCNIAEKFDMNGIEWSTKEQGATHVAALLLCIEGFATTTLTTTVE